MSTFEEILANNGLPQENEVVLGGGETLSGTFDGSKYALKNHTHQFRMPDNQTIRQPEILGGFLRNTEIDIKNTTGKNIFNVKRTGANVGDVTIGDYSGGSGALWDYSAGVFAVKGTITATLGEIGGWTIAATTLTSTNDEIVLDSANKKIESGNYVSGYAGAGFHLSQDLLEVGNISARGLIRTAVFQKDVISAVGGNLMVLDSDVLDANMTADDDSVLIMKGTTTFSVGDILRIKDGTDDEWMEYNTLTCDSYSESYQTTSSSVYNGAPIKVGQSFTGDGNDLNSCKFYLKKFGSPTGNVIATVYAHTGTFGSNGKPTGSALATSGNFDISTLTTSYALTTFTFTGANNITLVNGTKYFIVLEYSGGDVSNHLVIGCDDTTLTHGGNYASYTTSWGSLSIIDVCFYVYTEGATRDKAADYGADANPAWKKGATVVNYGQSGDGGIFMTASESNAPYLSVFTHAGSPWSALTTRLRIGNLNGYLGYTTDKYGIGIGDTTHYLKYDPTNHLRIAGNITMEDGSLIAGSITSKAITLAVAAGTGDSYIATGKTDFTNTQSGFILGIDDSDNDYPKFYIGDSTNYLNWNGTEMIVNASKIVKLFTAGMAINSGEAVLIHTDGKVYSTDALLSSISQYIGTAMENISKDATGLVQTFGNIVGLSGLVAASFYYLKNATHNIDQQQNSYGSIANAIPNSETLYQSFTTGGSITELSAINIPLVADGSSHTLTCRIREGEGTGGALIATKALTQVFATGGAPNMFYFDFPIVVSSSTKYTMTFQSDTAGLSWRQAALTTNPYADGRADTGVTDDYMFNTYYSTGRGALLSSVGTNEKKIGIAISSTEIVLKDSI